MEETGLPAKKMQSETSLSSILSKPQNKCQWMEKFKTLSDFSRSYSEAKWPYVLENKKMAYLSYTPTLFDISEI